jgi:hypothetical protein
VCCLPLSCLITDHCCGKSPNSVLRAAKTSGGREAIRRRRASGSPSHSAMRPVTRTRVGISKSAHKCAHTEGSVALLPEENLPCSNPVLPTFPFCCGLRRSAASRRCAVSFSFLRKLAIFEEACELLLGKAAFGCTRFCTHVCTPPGSSARVPCPVLADRHMSTTGDHIGNVLLTGLQGVIAGDTR